MQPRRAPRARFHPPISFPYKWGCSISFKGAKLCSQGASSCVCLPACLSLCVCVRKVLYPGDLVFALIMPTSHWHFKADFISHCLRRRVCECVCGDGGWHLGAMAPVWKFARQHITRFNDSSRMSQVSGQDNDFGRLFSRLTIWHFKVVLSTEDLIN